MTAEYGNYAFWAYKFNFLIYENKDEILMGGTNQGLFIIKLMSEGKICIKKQLWNSHMLIEPEEAPFRIFGPLIY